MTNNAQIIVLQVKKKIHENKCLYIVKILEYLKKPNIFQLDGLLGNSGQIVLSLVEKVK